MKALYQKIRSLDGKNYGLYKSLAEKPWDFGDFSLEFLHVQGDPYAPASRVLVKAGLQTLGYGPEWGSSFERRLALSDFLLRRLVDAVCERYPEKDGAVAMVVPGPEMVVRNSLWIDNGDLRACLQVRLPGDGRKIQAEAAAEILTMVLPDLVSTLYNNGARQPCGASPELLAHYQVLAERACVLEELETRGLVAFVPDGAVLPRESGISESPLASAVKFCAPPEMAVTLNVCGREVRGMGIPKGVTVITGGAFHGKSSLLQALVRSVYPHVPGDGREGVVVDPAAVRIGVEDGRSVRNTDLSLLVRDLPGGVSTRDFCTAGASGSTSEAANLLEAMEFGSRTFFIDEDSSAVNFLIRDSRVRSLLGDEREPLIPLADRMCEFASLGCSFIVVAGACGDFLGLADNIIVMADYRAECANDKISGIAPYVKPAGSLPAARIPECRPFAAYVRPLSAGLRPASAVERQVKVKLNGDALLQIGFLLSDTAKAGLLVDKQQRLAAGYMLLNLCQNAVSNNSAANALSLAEGERSAAGTKAGQSESCTEGSVASVINTLCDKIRNVGFRNLPQGMARELSLPRPVDVACVLFRLNVASRR